MCETTSTDFVGWQAYIDQELNMPRREDYYMAQIAAEVHRLLVKDPDRVRSSQFLLRFVRCVDNEIPVARNTQESRVAHSKATWGALMRMKPQAPPKAKNKG